MPKNIVFCADGTDNGPGENENQIPQDLTNVFKLFVNLQGFDDHQTTNLKNEQERALKQGDEIIQIAKYIHGVGDSNNILTKILGGAAGAGIVTRIVRGYTFISRNYNEGDNIYITGFSRGAYTARALAGLIAAEGLLNQTTYNNKEDAYRAGAAVWYKHQKDQCNKASQDPAKKGWLASLERAAADLPGFLAKPPTDNIQVEFIKAVGVWDTVGSLGLPDGLSQDKDIDVFGYADPQLPAKIQNGIHAISLDEQRVMFQPILWDKDDRVTQMLFPGAHADVGGGYPECGLSDFALSWMTGELQNLGLLIKDIPADPSAYVPHPNPADTAHQPWLSIFWRALPFEPRDFKGRTDILISPSITLRHNSGPVKPDPTKPPGPYDPINRP